MYAGKPWETTNISWIQMLDMVRYLIVWQPTILMGLHLIFHALHWDEVPGGDAEMAANGTAIAEGQQLGNATALLR